MSILDEMSLSLFGESSEKGDPKIPDVIEPAIKILESKGYKVKYASPGYVNTRFDNDRNKDGVINGKHQTTGRIVFSRNYNFPNTPDKWTWKVLNNNSKALYVKPYSYTGAEGKEDEAFIKWQTAYIDSLTTWAKALPNAGEDKKDTAPDENFGK